MPLLRDYLAAGTELVWIIDPDAGTVAVYTDPQTPTVLTEADTLTGGSVLPGFALPLTELFPDPQLNPRR
jgi:Uma2 family endonuclease